MISQAKKVPLGKFRRHLTAFFKPLHTAKAHKVMGAQKDQNMRQT